MTLQDLARADFLPQHIAAQLLTETEPRRDDPHAALWRALNTLAVTGGFTFPTSNTDEV